MEEEKDNTDFLDELLGANSRMDKWFGVLRAFWDFRSLKSLIKTCELPSATTCELSATASTRCKNHFSFSRITSEYMAASYDYEDATSYGQQLSESLMGYDPNFVLDSVKSFVVHVYRHIREKNVYEIHQMYETSFQTLSNRMFKDTPWPSVDAVL